MTDYSRAEVEAAMTAALQQIQPQVSAHAHVLAVSLWDGEMTETESILIEAGAHAGMAATLQVIAARGWLNPVALLDEVGDKS